MTHLPLQYRINCRTHHLLRHHYLQTESALLYDAVMLYANAFDSYVTYAQDVSGSTSVSCGADDTWPDGEGLMNVLGMVGEYDSVNSLPLSLTTSLTDESRARKQCVLCNLTDTLVRMRFRLKSTA